MKKHLTKIFAMMAMTMMSIGMWADNVSVTVSSDAELQTAYEAAYNSETEGTTVITMNAGSYVCQGMSYQQLQFPKVRSITLQAAEGAVVTLTTKVQCDGGGTPAGSLTFKGLNIRSTADNFITIQHCGNIDHISFINCDITGQGEGESHQWYRYIINSGNADYTLNTISFDGCTIHDMGNGYNLLPITHKVQNVSVTNSTLYNYKGDKFFCPQTATDEVFSFTFNNNTVYKWSTSSQRHGICDIGAKCTNASNVITFKDNIFWGKGDVDDSPSNNGHLLNASSGSQGTLIEQNNLLYQYTDEWNTGTFTKTISNLSYAGAIPFYDAATYDFSIFDNSTLATASTTGGVVGAPKWLLRPILTSTVLPIEKSGSVELSGDGVYVAGQTATLTATANYGYSFVKWVDADGNQLSTENPYNFTSVADATVNAVFAVNTSVYQNLPLSSALAYMDLTAARTVNGAIETFTSDQSQSIPYYQSASPYIKGFATNGASTAYVEFKVHNSTDSYYIINYTTDWADSESRSRTQRLTLTFTDDNTGEVVTQTFSHIDGNTKRYIISANEISAGYKTLRLAFNNTSDKAILKQLNFTTIQDLPITGSDVIDFSLSNMTSSSNPRYTTSDGSAVSNNEVSYIKNGGYTELYLGNKVTANYTLNVRTSNYGGEDKFTVTITDVETGTIEVNAQVSGAAISNIVTMPLTNNLTQGLKKIRFDYINTTSDSYLYNIMDVSFSESAQFTRTHPHMNLNTLCYPYQIGYYTGATFYTMLYKVMDGETVTDVYLQEHIGPLEAGTPYFYEPEDGAAELVCYYSGDREDTPLKVNGVQGSYDDNAPVPSGSFVTYNNMLRIVSGAFVTLGEYRAYVDMESVPADGSVRRIAGRRLLKMRNADAPAVATGIGNVQSDKEQTTKILRNGQLILLRDGKEYNVLGIEL